MSNKKNKHAKEQQGFEKDPARCQNCRHRRKESPVGQDSFFGISRCGLGGFIVKHYSICDEWTGYQNEKLVE